MFTLASGANSVVQATLKIKLTVILTLRMRYSTLLIKVIKSVLIQWSTLRKIPTMMLEEVPYSGQKLSTAQNSEQQLHQGVASTQQATALWSPASQYPIITTQILLLSVCLVGRRPAGLPFASSFHSNYKMMFSCSTSNRPLVPTWRRVFEVASLSQRRTPATFDLITLPLIATYMPFKQVISAH